MRRCVVISTAACFAISLRGNCYRWELCLHAGGAVVKFCRGIPVCWPQRSSTDPFCGLQYNPIRIQRLFLHTFSDKPEKVCRRRHSYSVTVNNGTPVPTGNLGRTESSAPTDCGAKTSAKQWWGLAAKQKTLPSPCQGTRASASWCHPCSEGSALPLSALTGRRLRRFRRSAPYTQTRRMSFARRTAGASQQNGSLSDRCRSGTASASLSMLFRRTPQAARPDSVYRILFFARIIVRQSRSPR